MFWKLPSWIPTKEDEIAYHNEKKAMLERDLLLAMAEQAKAMDEMSSLEEALVKTFSREQMELWYELKSSSKKNAFHGNHVRYMQEEIKETPDRITEILNS